MSGLEVNKDRVEQAAQFFYALPHAKALGVEFVGVEGNEVVTRMEYDERFVGDIKTGAIHGGTVLAMMDMCCGIAAVIHPENPGSSATIDLRVDHLRPATPGQAITARAEVYHITPSVSFLRASAQDEDETSPVATASGTFTVALKP